ncbi:hypothetical protein, partial [Litorimonas sp.]|uniref:hypothetical protein n=1 Tax=Litorimonas sp. TaxID=1892381 RepID=UPI003A842A70
TSIITSGHKERVKMLAVMCFTGPASTRAKTIGAKTDAFKNALDVKDYFEKTVCPMFSPQSDTLQSRNEYNQLKQLVGESTLSFATTKIALWTAAYSEKDRSFDQLRRDFISKLLNKEVARKLHEKECTTPEQLIAESAKLAALEREAVTLGVARSTNMDGLATSQIPYDQSYGYVKHTRGASKGYDPNAMDLTTITTPKDSTCNWCQKKGHWVRECNARLRGLPRQAKAPAGRGRGGGRGGYSGGGGGRQRPQQGQPRPQQGRKAGPDECLYCFMKNHRVKDCLKKKADTAARGGAGRGARGGGKTRPGVGNIEGEDPNDASAYEIETYPGQGEQEGHNSIQDFQNLRA